MYALTQQLTEAAGLPAYEISNHARPGAESRHNLVYWRYGDYAGVGPGAHGRLTVNGERLATETLRDPAAWLAASGRQGATTTSEALSPDDQATEYLMMSLRLSEGSDLARFARLNGSPLPEPRLRSLEEEGLVLREGDRLTTSPSGRPLLDAILRALLV